MMKHLSLYVLFFLLSFSTCKEGSVNISQLEAFTKNGVNAVIEIPAGTNKKSEYNSSTKRFEIETIKGKQRMVDFLPFPGNYGFIPSTYMDKDKGGDGDALDILVISETVPRGTVLEVKPIASLLLMDRDEIDTKIIAVPLDSTLQVIQTMDHITFMVKYNKAQQIIQDWFLSYKGIGQTELIGWRDDRHALAEIRKWLDSGNAEGE